MRTMISIGLGNHGAFEGDARVYVRRNGMLLCKERRQSAYCSLPIDVGVSHVMHFSASRTLALEAECDDTMPGKPGRLRKLFRQRQ